MLRWQILTPLSIISGPFLFHTGLITYLNKYPLKVTFVYIF